MHYNDKEKKKKKENGNINAQRRLLLTYPSF